MKIRTILFSIVATISLCGCVNRNYDLSKLDRSVQLLSGIEVAINPNGNSSTITAEDLFGAMDLMQDNVIKSDVEISQAVSYNEISGGNECQLDGTFVFDMNPVPTFLRNPRNDLKFTKNANIAISVTNPFDCSVSMDFDVTADAQDAQKCVMPIIIPPSTSNQSVSINLSDYFSYVPESITVDNITLKAVDTKSVAAQNAGEKVIFEIGDAQITVDASMQKDSKFNFQYDLSLKDDFEIDFEELGIEDADAKSFEIKGSIRTDLPIKLDAKTVEGSDVTATVTTIIAEDSEQWVDFTISIDCPGGLRSIKEIAADFNAVALKDIDFKNHKHSIELKMETLKLTEGIDVQF